MSVIPDTIALSDSATIICHAFDPDGDSLVYDWFTQLPVYIAGAPQDVYLYWTTSNTRVMYYAGPESISTSVPVEVFAREAVSGLQDGVRFRIHLRD